MTEGDSKGVEFTEGMRLLLCLIRQRWTVYAFGRRHQPDALGAVITGLRFTDVVIIRGHDRASAYRTICDEPGADPLSAPLVVWHYLGSVAPTIRAALGLPSRDEAGTDFGVPYAIPDECRVPEIDRRPYTVRPPQAVRQR